MLVFLKNVKNQPKNIFEILADQKQSKTTF